MKKRYRIVWNRRYRVRLDGTQVVCWLYDVSLGPVRQRYADGYVLNNGICALT